MNKYSLESVYVKVTRARDAEGRPTCAGDFTNNVVCQFHMTQKFGDSETCFFAPYAGVYKKELERRDDTTRSLVPIAKCPLWTKGAKKIEEVDKP
jgi:hypothetical protein